MTRRTLRERLAAGDAPPAVGTLVRVISHGSFTGMTGTVLSYDRFVPSCVSIRMTSTGHVLTFNALELIRVVDAGGSK